MIPSSDKEQANDAGGLIYVCLWLRTGSRPEVRVEEMGMWGGVLPTVPFSGFSSK